MKKRSKLILLSVAALVALAAGAVVLHMPATGRFAAHLHGVQPHGPAAVLVGGSEAESGALAAALNGIAALRNRWDEAAFAETIALYTDVHRVIEWPGLLPGETFRYGPDELQTLELFRPEQGFREPGPVFVFMHGNGLGTDDRVVPGSEGLIYDHVGKLGATAGGLGVTMSYRQQSDGRPDAPRAVGAGDAGGTGIASGTALESGAEDLRLVLEWIVANIGRYGGDPDTIVLIANSEGAAAAAAYLFDSNRQMATGPGIAAAVLSSGPSGDALLSVQAALDTYEGEPVPLALWSGELDEVAVPESVDALHERLCTKYGECPMREHFADHNHISPVLSLGTSDTEAMNAFIRFYHTVR